ncbi:hypothetical protein B0H63DRAFT_214371 [Podospora didyma]|uniref:Meiotic recombination protein DMC1 n=1 Tax=Podospora didyma TaxID=330526 RepID=A0AAE0TWD0_9PEZI|nr:hypothetical protein B0H63DRAFT_214371 [Podospora didyma]
MADNIIEAPAAGGGGFVPPLPSPAPSASSTRSVSGLPHPRGHALRPGSAKEDKVRHFVNDRMMYISRRFIKKNGGPLEAGTEDVKGYKSMAELCKDVEGLINIVWLSGTPSLQIPYLLNVAGEFNEWVKAFPPSPVATFSVLRKLDHCFASLLSGQDIETREPLPGFENGLRSGMSRTDMVRCKSMVEQTRVLVVDVMSKEPEQEEEEDGDADDGPHFLTADDTESGREGPGNSRGAGWDVDDDEDFQMDVARIYEHTLVQLGVTLGEGGGVGAIQISVD